MRKLVPKEGQRSLANDDQGSRTLLPAKPPRSRDGCQRCKTRRVKCDQARPSCRSCIAKNLPCPGYGKDLRWSTKYEVSQFTVCPPLPKRRRIRAALSDESARGIPAPSSLGFGRLDCADNNTSGSGTLGDAFPIGTDISAGLAVDPGFEVSIEPGAIPDDGSLDALYNAPHGLPDPYTTELGCSASTLQDSSILPEFTSVASPNGLNLSVDLNQVPEDDEGIDEYVQRSETVLTRPMHGRMLPSKHAPDPANLLRWFYRTQPSQYSDTDLVEHYFTNVCRLYAIFDSTKNPFRALVGSNWDSSGSISLAIQSMACAHLANNDSTMVYLGRQKQREARLSILNDLLLWKNGTITADRLLLAILLLGPTVSWHNTGDLGLDYLNIARELVTSKLYQNWSCADRNGEKLDQFFLHAMIYWEMMVAFVDKTDRFASENPSDLELLLPQTNFDAGSDAATLTSIIKPHPWTGIAPHVTMLFAEVGRIMRRRISGGTFATDAEERWASKVEEALTNAKLPALEDVVDYEDLNTPQDHFIQLAEAYRCAGLLHLYHTFPAILLRRMRESEMAMMDQVTDFDSAGWYRTTLALHILSMIENLPLSSGTSCLHPILVLTAGSELKFPDPMLLQQDIGDLTSVRIASARDFAERRLSDLARRLPQKPFVRMLDIMKETWLQLDMFGIDVHWMQTMYQKGWETIMG